MSRSQLFDVCETSIPDCLELKPSVICDQRGCFVKVFHKEAFSALGLEIDCAEEYYSVSKRSVIRGLHFQTPPAAYTKLVYCISGKVQDVVLDLRVGSPTFGKYAEFELSAEKANMVYIPEGLAHGFCVLSEYATMVYWVSATYSAHHDVGIAWDSVGIPWKTQEPLLSDRDRAHPRFSDYLSPFLYKGSSHA